MNLAELHADEGLRQRAFPVTRTRLYLAHAAVGPLPACVTDAMTDYLQQASGVGQFEHLHRAAEAGCRQLAADLLGVTPAEVALVPSTSAGLGMVAAGLEWQPGDNVVIAEADFSANVYPWLALERQGVRVKRIPARLDRAISVADVAEQLDDRTKLVALSAVHFVTGAALDVDAVGAFLKARGVLFCVDAIQAFGAVPVSARNVDFLAADGHKWLLGPQGLGVLVVRRPAMAHLRPVLPGWRSVPEPGKYYAGPLQWADSARRYEPGSLNAVGVVGLHAALQLLTDLGPAAIARHLRLLRAHLVDGLRERGYRIVGPAAGPLPSGIVAFAQEAPGPMAPIYQRLDAQGTVVSLRQTWRGEEVLRVAPHGYTTAAEVRRFLEQLGPAPAPRRRPVRAGTDSTPRNMEGASHGR